MLPRRWGDDSVEKETRQPPGQRRLRHQFQRKRDRVEEVGLAAVASGALVVAEIEEQLGMSWRVEVGLLRLVVRRCEKSQTSRLNAPSWQMVPCH